jgi:hypothetical protein
VKIRGTCKRCGREFMVEQVVDAGGVCPWDGEPFNPDYAAVLVRALAEAELHGSELEQAMQQISDLSPAFRIDEDSVLGDLKVSIARLRQQLVQQG